MMDCDKLVKALRRCAEPGTIIDECDTSDDCPYSLDGYCGDCMNNLVKDAAAAIEALQAQLPKRGKWIVHTEVKNIYRGICIECPVCRDHFVVLNVSDEKYCRSCGAKMEVQE